MNRISFRILNLLSSTSKYEKHISLFTKSPCLSPGIVLFQTFQKIKINTAVKLNTILCHRNYCSNSSPDEKKDKPNPLMKFTPVFKPEIMLTIKNWILTKIIIQPYLDSDFTTKDFTFGAKQVTSGYPYTF